MLGLIISLKAFYVLYLLTLVPILFYLKKQNINKLIKSFLKNFYFYLFIFVGFFLCLVNIFNTGCLIYPVEFTCFTKFDWSLKGEAKIMNDWYELWAKAGAGPNYRIDNPENYIQGFNWVNNWVDEYFFNKMSDFLFGVIFLLSIIYFTFYSKNKKKIKINKKIYGLYLVLLVLLIEWFYNHPSLRYGGYSLIALILFIPSSIYISKFLDKRKIKKKLIILISCCLIIFIGRNINRISYEINKYDYNVFLTPFYSLNENYFRIDKFMKKVEQNYKECKITNTKECLINNEIVIKENGNYLILMKKK